MYISLSANISILALMYMQHQLKILQDVEKQVGDSCFLKQTAWNIGIHSQYYR